MIAQASASTILEGFSRGAESIAAQSPDRRIAGFLFSPVGDDVEFLVRQGLSLELCATLSEAAGREILSWAMRDAQAHLLRRVGMESRFPALHAVMAEEDIQGLALLPVLGEHSVLGYFILGFREALPHVPGPTEAWNAFNSCFGELRIDAGRAVLRRLLGLHAEGLARSVRSLLVLDAEDRILFSHGMSRILPAWGRGEAIGQSLKSLPGGRVLAALDPPGSGHLDWRVRKVDLGEREMSLSLASLLLRTHEAGGSPWRAILLRTDDIDPNSSDGSILLELALRLEPEGTGIEVWENGGTDSLGPSALRAADQAQNEEAINLSGLFRGFIHRLEPELRDDRIRLLPFLHDELPLIRGDRQVLEAALWSMLRHAWTSLLPGGGTITLRTWEEGGSVWCTISDDGQGREDGGMMELLALEPLVGPGPPKALARSGIHLAGELLRRGGGSLHVETRDRLWTRYSAVFPAERVIRGSWANQASGVPPAVEVRRAPTGQLAVLVVDDNTMVRTVLRKYLERRGHEVMEAVDGGAALEILQDRAFDRVMVDIDMPGTTGVEFFQKLDSVNPTMRARTVFMTGGFQEPETEAFIQGTGRPHIQKPFDLEEIGDVLAH